VAAVVGSFAYNATMTLGAGALARPLELDDAASLHLAWLASPRSHPGPASS
jgi:cation:H+ antiporter